MQYISHMDCTILWQKRVSVFFCPWIYWFNSAQHENTRFMTIIKMTGLVICTDTDILLIGGTEPINLHDCSSVFFCAHQILWSVGVWPGLKWQNASYCSALFSKVMNLWVLKDREFWTNSVPTTFAGRTLQKRIKQYPDAMRSSLLNYPYPFCYGIWHVALNFTTFCCLGLEQRLIVEPLASTLLPLYIKKHRWDR